MKRNVLIVAFLALALAMCSKQQNQTAKSEKQKQQTQKAEKQQPKSTQTSKESKSKAQAQKTEAEAKKAEQKSKKKSKHPIVVFETTMGTFKVKLYPEKTPKTVENFLQYVKSGFYNGTIFHRVVHNFVIQGGGYTEDFKRKKTRPPIVNEAKYGLSNKRGTIAMARTAARDSATSQFFINLKDNPNLDYKGESPAGWGYCAFGEVIEGMDVVDKIGSVETGPGGPFKKDVPKQTIKIIKAYVLEE